MDSTTQTLVTLGVRVSVKSVYVAEQSQPANSYYVFAYRIGVKNESSEAVQLTHRFWNIIDGLGDHKTVEGEGVVGVQPIIQPGETYFYVSGSVMRTAIGKMYGFYTFVRQSDGGVFEARIPAFLLIEPSLLN